MYRILLLLIGSLIIMSESQAKNTKKADLYRYLVTYTKKANSFDPLNADSSENFESMRMLYATPIEITDKDVLASHVLSSYKYDKSKFIITWKLKSGIKYSDGSIVKPSDIAFAVARSAYTRPDLPVLYAIKGLSVWLKTKNPLECFFDIHYFF